MTETAIPETPQTKYKRVILKISGEALMGDQGFGLHPPTVARIASEVDSVAKMGVEVCMVIGGGNIFRGLAGSAQGMERTTADYMGMLATVMNALAMQSALEGLGVFTRVITAIRMDEVAEPYIRRRAVRHLEKKRVVVFAAGTGNPYFTTDTAATLRANEMACEAIFKGTKVDGVYDKDPKKFDDAVRYDHVSYDDALAKRLGVMDASAIALARDHPDVDAAICFNDLVALGMLAGCAQIGRAVGPGFRIVGFDDIEDCAQAWPSLSSVRCDIAAFGERMAATVLDWLEADVVPPPETRTPVELMIRESSRM